MNIIEEIRSKYQDVKKERNKNRKDQMISLDIVFLELLEL